MNQVVVLYKQEDTTSVLPLIKPIETAIGESCRLFAEAEDENMLKAVEIMQAIEQASIIILMYSHLHTQITNYSTNWTIRGLAYAQDKQKRIVFVGIDDTPITKWFDFMFPQQRLIDANISERFEKLLSDLPKWLGDGIDNNVQPVAFDDYTEGLEYKFHNKTHEATVCGVGSVRESYINIPPEVTQDGKVYRVSAIGKGAFKHCHFIISIRIPDGIKDIGRSAFEGCIGLAQITIPFGVTKIKKDTFYKCTNLMSVSIPSSVTHIHVHAFIFCRSLVNVTLPEGLKFIGSGAFSNCKNLTSINIPKSVTHIGTGAFYLTNTPKGKNSLRKVMILGFVYSIIFWAAVIACIIYIFK